MPAAERLAARIAEVVVAWVVKQDVGDHRVPAAEFEDESVEVVQEGHHAFGSDQATSLAVADLSLKH